MDFGGATNFWPLLANSTRKTTPYELILSPVREYVRTSAVRTPYARMFALSMYRMFALSMYRMFALSM